MKKLLVILCMLAYGFSASGMTLQLHYCCGKLKTIEWSAAPQKDCGNTHKMGSGACCETKSIRNGDHSDQEHVLVSTGFLKAFKGSLPTEFRIESQLLPLPAPQESACSPSVSGPPLFLQYRVFRI